MIEVETYRRIICDGCRIENHRFKTDARQALNLIKKKEGWSVKDQKQYCPTCVGEKKRREILFRKF